MRIGIRKGDRGRLGDSSEAPSLGGAVGKFALAGLVALAVVAVVSILVLRSIGTSKAIDNAKQLTRIVGNGIVEPQVGRGVLRGSPAALHRLDRIVRHRVLRDPIVRVKLWTSSGRLLYSDEPRLIGDRFSLDPEDLQALRTGAVAAEVSDLSRPENRFERGQGKLLEVYQGIRARNGRPLLFEAYQQFSTVTSSAQDIYLAFVPALIAALIVLELVQIPLASSMVRRLRRGQRERESLLRRAVDASDAERRRIAADLHDGIVQDLAGLSYSLSAAADRGGPNGDDPTTAALREGALRTRHSVRELRGLLVEIYPPSLQRAGLAAALSDLVAPCARHGIETRLVVPDDLALPARVEALVYRVAQEAVRNAAAHADPRRVEVRVEARGDDRVGLTVSDDGRGFDAEAPEGASEPGHLGLTLLRDLARDAGAELEIDSAPGRGTRVRLEAPTS